MSEYIEIDDYLLECEAKRKKILKRVLSKVIAGDASLSRVNIKSQVADEVKTQKKSIGSHHFG